MEMGQAWLWNEDFVHANGKLLGGEREPELGGRRHYHVDHLGSTRMVSTWDGYRLTEHKYLPFGVEATKLLQEKSVNFDHESKLKYTGHERDYLGGELVENTNYLDYMHARYFNPNFGRFLSVDPVLDMKEAMTEPQNWNRYAYVSNNPMKYLDPDGRFKLTANRTGAPSTGYTVTYFYKFETEGKFMRGARFIGEKIASKAFPSISRGRKVLEFGKGQLVGKEQVTTKPEFLSTDGKAQIESRAKEIFEKAVKPVAPGIATPEQLPGVKKAFDQAIGEYAKENKLKPDEVKELRKAYDIEKLREAGTKSWEK
jgi:RHS repeat-associated protein